MGVKEQFEAGIKEAKNISDDVIIKMLFEFGYKLIDYAFLNKQAGNVTFNLQDSYGFAVYNNRRMIGHPRMIHSVADEPDTEGGWGSERGKRFLEEYRPKTRRPALIIVAGEFYSDYLETHHWLDILTGTFFYAEIEFMSSIKLMPSIKPIK